MGYLYFRKNDYMSYPPNNIIFRGKPYNYYWESGGGIGDIFMWATCAGIFHFLENKLDGQMAILLWCAFDHVRGLFSGYKGVDVYIFYTHNERQCPFEIPDKRVTLGMPSFDSEFMQQYFISSSKNVVRYMVEKGITLEQPIKGIYLYHHAYPIVEFDTMMLPNMLPFETRLLKSLKDRPYCIINPTSSCFNLPSIYIIGLLEILYDKFIILILGKDNSLPTKLVIPPYMLCHGTRYKGVIDLRDKTSLHGAFNLIKNSHAVFVSMSSLFLMAAISNKPCLLLIDDDRMDAYRRCELSMGTISHWIYKFYMYHPTICILMMDHTKYNLISDDLSFYGIGQYKLNEGEFIRYKVRDINNTTDLASIINSII